MKLNYEDRLNVLFDPHGYLMDLQICPCELKTLGAFDSKKIARELITNAYCGYGNGECNHRIFEWILTAKYIATELIGKKDGDVPKERLYEVIKKIAPEYKNESIDYKEADRVIDEKIEKTVARSLEAKRHFLVFPENPKLWSEIKRLLDLYGENKNKISDADLGIALWAHGEGFNDAYKEHDLNRATVSAIFSEYPEFCYNDARAALKDSLKQYGDKLLKLKLAAIAEHTIECLAKTGRAKKPKLPEKAMKYIKKIYLEALEFDSTANLALIDAYTHPKIRGYKNPKAAETEFNGFNETQMEESVKINFRKRREEFREKLGALEILEKSMINSEPSEDARQTYFGILEEITEFNNEYRLAEDDIEKQYAKIEEKQEINESAPLVLDFSKANENALSPIDMDAPRTVAINWEESNRDALEAWREVKELLLNNSKELEKISKHFTKDYLLEDNARKNVKDFTF